MTLHTKMAANLMLSMVSIFFAGLAIMYFFVGPFGGIATKENAPFLVAYLAFLALSIATAYSCVKAHKRELLELSNHITSQCAQANDMAGVSITTMLYQNLVYEGYVAATVGKVRINECPYTVKVFADCWKRGYKERLQEIFEDR